MVLEEEQMNQVANDRFGGIVWNEVECYPRNEGFSPSLATRKLVDRRRAKPVELE